MTYLTKLSSSDGTGEFTLYVAEPDGMPHASILVIQEIYGVNADIRRKCDLLAQQGYLAIAPDLFWRLEPGIELDPYIRSTKHRSIELAKRFDSDIAVSDIQTTINKARALAGEKTRVGLIGYSLGGRMAAFAAARTDIDASVGYYGVRIQIMLGKKDAIASPLLLHIAELDSYVDKQVQAELHRAFDDHPKVTLHSYPGQQHDFAYEFGPLRSEDAVKLADQRTLAFIEENLRPT
jgi:carboxymethylenebutenolidase